MRNVLQLTPVSVHRFTWTRTRNGHLGVADASDLPAGLVSRVYSDAADVGFRVVGRTGRDGIFTLVQDLKGLDGELAASVYECDTIPNVSIHILND